MARRKRRRRLRVGRIIAALAILAAVIVAVVFVVKALCKTEVLESDSSSSSEASLSSTVSPSSDESIDTPPEAPSPYETLQLSSADLHRGDLILVNADAHYQTDAPNDLVAAADYQVTAKNETVQLRKKIMAPIEQMMTDFVSATGLKNVYIMSGHRTVEYQQMLYDNDLKRTGLTYSDEVAKPGESEHHTGLVFDLGIMTQSGSKFFDASGDYIWINQNCQNYGFVVRYPESKKDITKIIHEPWHYRYVGVAHAAVMTENNFCLEEYISYLKQYPFEGEHLKTTVNDVTYEIYYVPATGDSTAVSVPKDLEYDWSGNNVDGFVVTVKQA